MTQPRSDCHDIALEHPYPLDEAGEVALEDYARTLTRAAAAEALYAPGAGVRGVHLCGLATDPSERARADIAAFADSLGEARANAGLGWN